MLYIKEKNAKDRRVGILLKPNLAVTNDVDLHRSILKYGRRYPHQKVMIAVGVMGSEGIREITAQEFCNQWIGD